MPSLLPCTDFSRLDVLQKILRLFSIAKNGLKNFYYTGVSKIYIKKYFNVLKMLTRAFGESTLSGKMYINGTNSSQIAARILMK